MNKLVLIFDYFKEAFHINKQNKALYKPQIALIAIKVLLFLFVGIGVYSWIGIDNINALSIMEPEEMFGLVLSQSFKLLGMLLVYALISVAVESGLLNMYKKAVTQGYTEAGDFKEGLSKYFFKLLIGEVLIIICYVLSLPFYLILGIITLTVGLSVIPIVAGIFLTMWKVSLVMNDIGIFAAVKDSFGFAKRNFIPLAVLQIIHWSFAQGASGGSSGGSSNINIPDTNSFNSGLGEGIFGGPAIDQLEPIIRIIKIVVAVLLPVISIAIIGGSVIAMIFEVFFSLALFVTYKNGFKIEEKQAPIIEEPMEALPVETPEAVETDTSTAENTSIVGETDNAESNQEISNKEVEQ